MRGPSEDLSLEILQNSDSVLNLTYWIRNFLSLLHTTNVLISSEYFFIKKNYHLGNSASELYSNCTHNFYSLLLHMNL